MSIKNKFFLATVANASCLLSVEPWAWELSSFFREGLGLGYVLAHLCWLLLGVVLGLRLSVRYDELAL